MRIFLALLLTACLPAVLPALAQNTVRFTFSPPDGAVFIETRTTTTEINAPQKTFVVDTKQVQGTITKTATGYLLAQKILTNSTTEDGAKVDSGLDDLLRETTITYVLDKKGHMLHIEGYDAMVARMKKLFTAKQIEENPKQFNDKLLAKADAGEWEERVGQYIDTTVKPGDTQFAIITWDTPLVNQLPFYTRTTFAGTITEDGHNRYHLKMTGYSDPAALAKATGKTLDELARALGKDRRSLVAPEGIIGTFESDRIIDLETLLTVSEKSIHALDATVPKQDGGTLKFSMKETYERNAKK